MAEPRRALTLFDVACIGVNAIVGSSIFLFPGRLAGLLGPASILAFGLTGLLLISVALCFAEAAGRFDGHGGPYLYAREAFGPTVGFGIGWMCWLTQIVSWAAVANGIAAYLGFLSPEFERVGVVKAIAGVVIVAMGAINYRGVKYGAWTTNVFTLGKLVPLALFIALGLPRVDVGNLAPFAPEGFKPLGAACFLAYFAFQGFEVVPVPAGECVRPQRNVPLAVVGALTFAAVVYMLVQLVAVGVNPDVASSTRPLADSAMLVMGTAGAGIVVAGSVLSMIGFNAGCALGGPRYLAALGIQGDLPARVALPHPQYGTPSLSIVLTTALALAAAMLLDFDKLVDVTNVVVCVQYVATCASVMILRRRGPAPGFRLPGGWLIPAAGIAATCWLGAQGGFAQVSWSLILLAAGFAVRWGLSWLSR